MRIVRSASFKTTVERSRFFAVAFPAATEEDVLHAVKAAKSEHRKANHHCWAFRGRDVAGALALVTVTVLGVWYIPELDWRHWRYEIREEEIDIKRGWLTTTRTLVPISRVQHIDTQRSPVERRFRAATLIIHTAAGTVTIPALPDEVATSVGARITALANIHDDL